MKKEKHGFRMWKSGKTWMIMAGVVLVLGGLAQPLIANADTEPVTPKTEEVTTESKADLIVPESVTIPFNTPFGNDKVRDLAITHNSKGELVPLMEWPSAGLSGKIVNPKVAGSYDYKFYFEDDLGVMHSATTTIIVEENKAAINLTTNHVQLTYGQTFNASDYIQSAYDTDGIIAIDPAQIKIDGTVDMHKIGNTQVKYSFTDSAGFEHSQTLSVDVESKSALNLTTSSVDLTCGDSFNAQDYFTNAVNADGATEVNYSQLQVDSNVDTSKDGNYNVNYSFIDATGQKIEKNLAVNVADKSKFALTTSEVTLTCGDSFNPSEYISSAINSDGKSGVDISKFTVDTVNTGKAGDYQVTYSFINSAGHTLSQSMTVHVLDKASLNLATSTIPIHAGNEFKPFDYFISAFNSDGKTSVETSQIKVDHNVNMNQAGTYQATYSFVDSSGNTISQVIYVEVYGQVPIAPVVPPAESETPTVKPITPVIPTTTTKKATTNKKVSTTLTTPVNNVSTATSQPTVKQTPKKTQTTKKNNSESEVVPTLPSFVDNKGEKKDNTLENSDSFLQSGKKDKQANKGKTKSQSKAKPSEKTKTMKQAVLDADSSNLKHKKKNNVIQMILKFLGALLAIVLLIFFIIFKRRKKNVEDSEE